MKSFTMKALAVAVLGLAGVGSAMACPAIDQTVGQVIPGGGGAWSKQFRSADASLSIVTPGLNNSACTLSAAIGATSSSRTFVEDDSPQAPGEPEYRGRVYVSLNSLLTGATAFNQSNRTAIIFRANATTGPAQFTSDQLVIRIAGGAGALGTATAPSIRFAVSDANPASGLTSVSVPLPASATNTFRIEWDLQTGAAATSAQPCNPIGSGGCLRYWVTDAAATTTDTAPTGSVTVNNSGWSGVKTAFLGLTTGTPGYRANHAGVTTLLDEFDTRRKTFIGQ